MKERKESNDLTLPKEILLIDDDIREINRCKEIQGYFEELGIKVHAALVIHPSYFSEQYLNNIQECNQAIYDQVEAIFNDKIARLNETYQSVLEPEANDDNFITKCINTAIETTRQYIAHLSM
jgi:hypothetical protein